MTAIFVMAFGCLKNTIRNIEAKRGRGGLLAPGRRPALALADHVFVARPIRHTLPGVSTANIRYKSRSWLALPPTCAKTAACIVFWIPP
jgi:hypothetical protein